MGGPLRRSSALALAAALLCAVALAACGGDDDSGSTTATATSGESGDQVDGDGGGTGNSAQETNPDGDPDRSDRGEGELHLDEFGVEASDDDFGNVAAIVVPYLEAVGNEEWAKACTFVLEEVKAQLGAQMSKSGDCGTALPAIIEASAQQGNEEPVYASEGIASLRIKKGGPAGEGVGFALFRASNGEDHWILVKKQDGEWGVLSTIAQPLQ